MKYLLYRSTLESFLNYYVPIVFDDGLIHAFVHEGIMKCGTTNALVGGGFVYYKDGKWVVSKEKSTSLAVGPSKMCSVVLPLFLEKGLSGLDLANMIAYLEIEELKNPSRKKRKAKL